MASILTRDKEAVYGNFEYHEFPMWAIYEGSKPLDQCCLSEEKERATKLKKYLDFMQDSGTTAQFEIRYYDEAGKNGKVNTSTPYFASLPFKVNDTEKQMEMQLMNKSGGTGAMANQQVLMMWMESKLENIQQNFNWQLQKKEEEIQALEAALAEGTETEEYGNDALGMIGKIGEIGEKHTWIQEPIKNIMSIFTDFANGAKTKLSAMTERPVQMAGIPGKPEDPKDVQGMLAWSQKSLIHSYRVKNGVKFNDQNQVLEESKAAMIEADKQYVGDMVKLAEIAATKPNTFDNAIKSLREL